jgi:cold shock CspA family protein
MKGKVKKIIWDRGFGFIATEDGKDVFFHRSALMGIDLNSLTEGIDVDFDSERTPKGVQAINVRMSETSSKEDIGTLQAYCMKCRTKREMKNTESITMKNGRPATQGLCSVCDAKMFRIGKS